MNHDYRHDKAHLLNTNYIYSTNQFLSASPREYQPIICYVFWLNPDGPPCPRPSLPVRWSSNRLKRLAAFRQDLHLVSRFDTFSTTLPSGKIRFDSFFKRQFRRKQKQQTKTLPPHIFIFRHVDSAWIFPLFSGYGRSFPGNFRQGKKWHMFMQSKVRAAEKVPNTSQKMTMSRSFTRIPP